MMRSDRRHASGVMRPAIGRAAWRRSWPALVFYTILAVLMTYPLIRQLGAAIPGDSFDGWQNYWNLWWIGKALVERGVTPFFTDMLYYPTGVSLAFQTLNPFNGLFTMPMQMAGNLFLAYNLVVYFSFVVGAFGAYLLARYVVGKAGWRGEWTVWPALLAGVIYGFSPFHFAHLLGHMQVFSLEWLPFAVLASLQGFDRISQSLKRQAASLRVVARSAAWIGLFLIFVGLCDWYYALYLALFSALLVVYRLLGRALRWQHVAMVGAAWILFLLVLFPMWLPMVQEARQASYMVPEREQALRLSADLLAFVTPNEFHPLWGQAAGQFAGRFRSTVSERTVFAGYIPITLGVIAAFTLGRKSRFWWISTLTFVLFALGPVLHIGGQSSFGDRGFIIPLPYALVYDGIPFIKIARSISRFDVMVMLSLSVLSALGLGYLMRRTDRARIGSSLLGPIVVCLVCFEFWSSPYPVSPPDTPAYYDRIAGESGQFAVLNLPMNWDRPGYLLYQTVHGKPLTAGYISRDDPRTLVYRAPVLQEFRSLGSDILCDDVGRLGQSVLGRLGIGVVVLDRYKMPSGLEREVTLELAEAIFAGQAPAYEDDRLTVYWVESPMTPLPFAILGDGWGARESDGGAVWRSLGVDAGQATLFVEAPVGQEVRLGLTVRGPAGSALTLRVDDGTETVTHLDGKQQRAEIVWLPQMEPSLVELGVLGPGPFQVFRVDVQ